ncbi:DUF7289 family protein [Natronorubrum halophilum]|uniref:DUF7289 family protein n=1 Tax=Natronorubrum halophilum TaxID=1702106 RepID=UPI0010C176C5|nr:hypothetical protein [Natronorubrum halophilum]
MIDRRTEPATVSRADDRGVSEVIAFILVFAMILGSVGLLYVTGFQAMGDYQETEQLVNAERAMDALADNFNDVLEHNGVNQRYGELSLRDGTVSTGSDGTKLNITLDDKDDPIGTDGDRFSGYGDGATVDLGEFTYTSDGDKIAYEGGGLVRADDSEDWSLVRKRPQIRCGDNAATISLAAVSADDRSIQSASGLGFTMSVENRSSAVHTGVDNVSIAIDEDDTAYDDAWESIFSVSNIDGSDWDWDGSAGTCDFDEDSGQVVVTIVEVDIEY